MNTYKNIYWIGGSPCCGKSSITELIVKNHGFEYYKCDDRLDEYVKRGTSRNIEIMNKFASMSIDEIWLRNVENQVADEFDFYRETFAFIEEDLAKLPTDKPVILEGAALLPELMKMVNIDPNKYICIVPNKTFQIEKYSQRGWVQDYLKDCSDPKQAFENWMNRDIEFALKVKEDAIQKGLEVIVVDGSKSLEENYEYVKAHFGI